MRRWDCCSRQSVVLSKEGAVVPGDVLSIVAVAGLEVRSGVVGGHVPAEGDKEER